MTVLPLTFADCLPVWRDQLWPGRRSAIEAFNQIPYLGGHDPTIQPVRVHFCGIKNNDRIIAVASGFLTSSTEFRLRGVFVESAQRRRGAARLMLEWLEIRALQAGAQALWSAPRASALPLYLSLGFTQTSPFTDDGFEFGPNCFVQKRLPP